tara:strand:+ start:312 stop:530 length:219 start_codon:yes stop_codon:yes gene_type:complete
MEHRLLEQVAEAVEVIIQMVQHQVQRQEVVVLEVQEVVVMDVLVQLTLAAVAVEQVRQIQVQEELVVQVDLV